MRCNTFRPIHLHVEQLEDRNLLSGTSHPYPDSAILVRFRPEATAATMANIVDGAVIEPAIPLVSGLHKIDLPAGESVAAAVQAYQASSFVLYAEPDYQVSLTNTFPNDPDFSKLYGLYNTGQTGGVAGADIHAPAAWDVTTGTTAVTVAVIDTGVDYTHPDLYENIWINQAEIPASRLANLTDVDGDGLITFYDLNDPINQGPGKISDIDGDGDINAEDILAPMDVDTSGNDLGTGGWARGSTQDGDTAHPDDLIGWNDYNNNNKPVDAFGHGTHVAGTIGAIGNNGLGITGVNWKVQIMPLRIFADDGGLTLNDKLINMLSFAVQHGAMISNNSYDLDYGYSQAVKDAITAAGQAGHIYVVAAANNGDNIDNNPHYPASFKLDNMISVAATDDHDGLASFSNYGAQTVTLGAPGVSVYSTLPTQGSYLGQNYGYLSGTSMATPHVVGVVALVAGLHPDWSYTQIISAVTSTVDPVQSLNGKTVTGGRLNAAGAVNYMPNAPLNHTGTAGAVALASLQYLTVTLGSVDSLIAGRSESSVLPSAASKPEAARSQEDLHETKLPRGRLTTDDWQSWQHSHYLVADQTLLDERIPLAESDYQRLADLFG
jgi:subtilisin family serine protease